MGKFLLRSIYYIPFFILGQQLINYSHIYYGVLSMLVGFKIWDEVEWKEEI